jgi:class 3 adenylate cyclase
LGLPEIEVGIGISTGNLVVGSIGTEKRRKYGAIGTPINVAFRLEEKARPGEILVTEGVKRKIGSILQIGSRWNESLKGIGKTVIHRGIGLKKA